MIGPEAPLVDGLADRLRAEGKLVFGPGADGAQLEGSKAWMKQVLVDGGRAHRRATRRSTRSQRGRRARLPRDLPGLYVVKTDGLAAGKGVLVTESLAEAVDDVRAEAVGRVVRRRRAAAS